MTVAALTEHFLMNMGYARSDLAEEDVIEEYSGVLLRWLNEGYLRALRRLKGRKAASAAGGLCCGACTGIARQRCDGTCAVCGF